MVILVKEAEGLGLLTQERDAPEPSPGVKLKPRERLGPD